MKHLKKILLLLFILVLPSAHTIQRVDYRNGMHNNVCKDLKGEILLYLIFVDNQETVPWTEFDIQSTLDSLAIAIAWLEKQARKNNIILNVKSDYYIGDEYTTIKQRLPQSSVQATITTPNFNSGIETMNEWVDDVCKRAGRTLVIPQKDGIPEIRQPRNKERLVAFLRDAYRVESVTLLLMLNNYYKNDISIPLNTMNNEDVEYAIVSYKYPSDIAHNVLHLFGAADLHESLYRSKQSSIDFAEKNFPNDIMQDTYARGINKLKIGEYTQYLIGWNSTLKEEYKPLLKDKIINFK